MNVLSMASMGVYVCQSPGAEWEKNIKWMEIN